MTKKCRVEDGLRYCYCGKCKRTGYPLPKDMQRIYNLMMEKVANQEMPPITNNSSGQLLQDIENPGFVLARPLKNTWYNRFLKWIGFYGDRWIVEPEELTITVSNLIHPGKIEIINTPSKTPFYDLLMKSLEEDEKK